jgi:hypothetical protein
MRSHHDIDRDNIKYYKKAVKVGVILSIHTDCSHADQFSSTTPWPSARPTTDMLSTFLLAAWIKLVFWK